ncbi:MAG: hypothetical protein KKD44_27645 [Proteobacteria bacterium]|nr:hypothetical protein [Pseudomonadota bacterium]
MAIIDVQIALGDDDSYDIYGTNYPDSNYVYISSVAYEAGLRWDNIAIDAGATIDTCICYIELLNDSYNDINNVVMDFEAADNPADFGSRAPSTMTPTGTSVIWNEADAVFSPNRADSPELKTSLQAVIDRPGWNSGQAIALNLDPGGANAVFDSVNYNRGREASIYIDWSSGAAAGQPYSSRVQGVQGMRTWGGI